MMARTNEARGSRPGVPADRKALPADRTSVPGRDPPPPALRVQRDPNTDRVRAGRHCLSTTRVAFGVRRPSWTWRISSSSWLKSGERQIIRSHRGKACGTATPPTERSCPRAPCEPSTDLAANRELLDQRQRFQRSTLRRLASRSSSRAAHADRNIEGRRLSSNTSGSSPERSDGPKSIICAGGRFVPRGVRALGFTLSYVPLARSGWFWVKRANWTNGATGSPGWVRSRSARAAGRRQSQVEITTRLRTAGQIRIP
jgi:hypothetical protein